MDANKVKVQQLKTGQLIITIPRSIAASKGWGKGTILEYKEDRFGALTLQEAKE
ncbi:hypothetical protein [Methanosarcina horonobensis]|uniref:hypothetical protein n=1 Tax=Methanosarcina horonobensis TaxID=418008 RepID=UPI000A66DAFD|nr:hypothetical protein [Methanosarcina horonobensis]